MKENLLESLAKIMIALELNEVQSIEVRGAIAEGVKFQSALAVIDEDVLKEIVVELKLNEEVKKSK